MGACGGMPEGSVTLLRRIFVEEAAEGEGGDPCGHDAGNSAAGGKHPTPGEASDDVVVHRCRPYLSWLEAVADRRDDKRPCLVEVSIGGRDHLEDPAGEELLDRSVEGHRGEGRVDVAAEDAGV